MNPAAGDLHLRPGSPAIDNANSGVANWPATDAEGKARWDDPTVPNTGPGPVPYAERGALEFQNNLSPLAVVNAWPSAGISPLPVTADASGSSDPDGTIVSYRFDFGDGTVVGPQSSATATHVYLKGDWTLTLSVTDNGGSTASGTALITVADADRAPIVLAPATDVRIGDAMFTLEVTASDPDGQAIESLTAAPLPPGTQFVAGPGNHTGTLTLLPSFSFPDTFAVTFSATALGLTGTATTVIQHRDEDHAPKVTAPASASVAENQTLTFGVSAEDQDDDPISSLVAVSLPTGAAFVTSADHKSGTLTWSPGYSQAGAHTVVFKATANSLIDSVATIITVTNVDRAPTVSAPATVSGRAEALLTIEVTASDPDGDAIDTLAAAPLPAGASFVAGAGNTSGTLSWTPTPGDTGVRLVTFTATNSLSGTSQTTITVASAHQPPLAALLLTPSSGEEPLAVTADATGSSGAGGTNVSYRFEFGDGAVVGPQVSPIAAHTYLAGSWTASVTVTDSDGRSASASRPIVVTAPANLCLNPSFEASTTGWDALASATLSRVAGGQAGGYAAQLVSTSGATSSFGLNDHPDWVRGTAAAGIRYRFSAWVRSPANSGTSKIQINEYLIATGSNLGQVTSAAVKLSPSWQRLTVDYVTTSAASTLDFWIKDWPLIAGETFQIDNVSVSRVVSGASAAPALAGSGAAEAEPMPGPANATEAPLMVRLWPSPLESRGTMSFATSVPGPLTVELLDLAGRRVRRLMDEADAPAGFHVLTLDGMSDNGTTLHPGVYFYRVHAREGVRTGRFAKLR